jgi:hypothetical protein
MELIQVYHASIKEYQFDLLDKVEDTSLAKSILKKYTLNG